MSGRVDGQDAALLPGLNGNLAEEAGKVFARRLNLSRDGENWFIEFNDDHGTVEDLPAASGDNMPTHTLRLKPDAKVFEGQFTQGEKFLKFGVVRKRGDGGFDRGGASGDIGVMPDPDYSDWYGDPTSRGMAC